MHIRRKWGVGDKVLANSGFLMECISVDGSEKSRHKYEILIQGQDETFIVDSSMFQSGYIKNHNKVEFGAEFRYKMHTIISRVMSLGAKSMLETDFEEFNWESDDLHSICMSKWASLKERTNIQPDSKNWELYPSYKEVRLCEDLDTLDKFKEWFISSNRYKNWHMDKDIFSTPSNKIYSKDTLIFIPSRLNQLLGYMNNIVGENQLIFSYKISGERYFHNVISYAEKIRLNLVCRCTWVRLWLRVNKGVLSENVEIHILSRIEDIEKNIEEGLYDNVRRGDGYKIF